MTSTVDIPGRLYHAAIRLRAVVAGVWSAAVALVGLLWTARLLPFPFGSNDSRAHEVGSLLAGADAVSTGLAVAGFGVGGVLLAVHVARGRPGRVSALACWVMGAVLVLLVPDIRMIQNFAYLFFGYIGLWDWPLLAMVVSVGGGVLWATLGASISDARSDGARSDGARSDGARSDGARSDGARSDGVLRRWLLRHRVAVTWAAAGLALPYPLTRIAWAVGIPLGMDPSMVEGAEPMLRIGEALLGSLAIGGAVLTVGLVRPWGVRFPRWVPIVRGRRVPVWFAAVPGTWASIVIVQAGMRVLAWTVAGDEPLSADTWGAGAPGLFWLPWGLAVGAATYAYVLYRRRCG